MQKANALFLVLDMQNDLVHDDGPNGKGPLGEQVRERQIISKTAAAIEKARAANILVGFWCVSGSRKVTQNAHRIRKCSRQRHNTAYFSWANGVRKFTRILSNVKATYKW